MILSRLSPSPFEVTQHFEPSSRCASKRLKRICLKGSSLKQFPSLLENELAIWDNKALIRKYYPKKVISIAQGTCRIPTNLKSCVKRVSSLKILYISKVDRSLRPLKKLQVLEKVSKLEEVLQLRKMILAAKRLDTLKLKGLRKESVKNIKCLRTLQVLDLALDIKYLETFNKSILGLDSLTSISLVLQTRGSSDVSDSHNFLDFCKNILAKKQLRSFNLDFDSSHGYSSTYDFEALFGYLGQSKVEQWTIQAILLEDRVLDITTKCDIFRQTQHLAVHSYNVNYRFHSGMNALFKNRNEPQENMKKMLNIYVVQNNRREGFAFDFESMLRHCTSLEYFFLEWKQSLLKQVSPLEDNYETYSKLKTFKLDLQLRNEQCSWMHLWRILERSPFLETFDLSTFSHFSMGQTQGADDKFIEGFVKRLIKMKDLKDLSFNLIGLSQKALEIFQSLFEALANFRELRQLGLKIAGGSKEKVPLLSKIPFDSLVGLTRLRLDLPDFSEISSKNMNHMMSKFPALEVIEFKINGSEPVPWNFVQTLMKSLRKSFALKKFIFSGGISFDSPDDQNCKAQADLIKKEINTLIIECQKLDSVQVIRSNKVVVEYKTAMSNV